MAPAFRPGRELSRRLYTGAVAPLLARHVPGLVHSAALLGPGSDVLGFDTPRSADHDWGPRLQLFVAGPADRDAATAALAGRLPSSIAGYPVDLATRTGRIPQPVTVAVLDDWLTGHLGFDPSAGISTTDWLATPTQTLAEVTAGVVHHDGLGRLTAVRKALAWYPDDVWRYVLAAQWQRIGQEEAFPGRCAEVGDDLGSAVAVARLVRDLMRLSLLIDRIHPPYGKWLGTAFARSGAEEADALRAALTAAWPEREDHLCAAYESMAGRQNGLGLAPMLDPRVRPFHDRPFRVLRADRFARALAGRIGDPALRRRPLTGAVDQVTDSTDVLGHRGRTRALTAALDTAG
jgi:hypothetical protein